MNKIPGEIINFVVKYDEKHKIRFFRIKVSSSIIRDLLPFVFMFHYGINEIIVKILDLLYFSYSERDKYNKAIVKMIQSNL